MRRIFSADNNVQIYFKKKTKTNNILQDTIAQSLHRFTAGVKFIP